MNSAWGAAVHVVAKSQTQLSDWTNKLCLNSDLPTDCSAFPALNHFVQLLHISHKWRFHNVTIMLDTKDVKSSQLCPGSAGVEKKEFSAYDNFCGANGLPWWLGDKENTCSAGDTGSIPGSGRSPGEENMATHSSILAWRISWTEEPGRHRVGHDWSDWARMHVQIPWQISSYWHDVNQFTKFLKI